MSSDLANNSVIRFLKISRRRNGLFADFKVKGERAGVVFTASISVDIAAADVDPTDPLEKIIEVCACMAEKELKRASFQFEGLPSI